MYTHTQPIQELGNVKKSKSTCLEKSKIEVLYNTNSIHLKTKIPISSSLDVL